MINPPKGGENLYHKIPYQTPDDIPKGLKLEQYKNILTKSSVKNWSCTQKILNTWISCLFIVKLVTVGKLNVIVIVIGYRYRYHKHYIPCLHSNSSIC
jgi:hypothetical protein